MTKPVNPVKMLGHMKIDDAIDGALVRFVRQHDEDFVEIPRSASTAAKARQSDKEFCRA